METIRSHVEPRLLLPVYCSTTEFGNARIKPLLTTSLVDMVEPAFQECPRILHKHVVRLAFQQVSETKTDMKTANGALLKQLYRTLGEELFSPANTNRLSPANLTKLRSLAGAPS